MAFLVSCCAVDQSCEDVTTSRVDLFVAVYNLGRSLSDWYHGRWTSQRVLNLELILPLRGNINYYNHVISESSNLCKKSLTYNNKKKSALIS